MPASHKFEEKVELFPSTVKTISHCFLNGQSQHFPLKRNSHFCNVKISSNQMLKNTFCNVNTVGEKQLSLKVNEKFFPPLSRPMLFK